MYFRTGEQNTHAENSSGNIGQFKHEPAEIDVHRVRSLFIRVGSRRFLFLSILLSSNFKGVRILLPSRLSPTEPVVSSVLSENTQTGDALLLGLLTFISTAD